MSNAFSCVGRLAIDSKFDDGQFKILKFRMASDVGFGDKKTTLWIQCNMWGARGEKLTQYLKKGQQVFVTGELSNREYTTREGEKRTSLELNVQQLDMIGKNDKAEPDHSEDRQATKPKATPAQESESDSEFPF